MFSGAKHLAANHVPLERGPAVQTWTSNRKPDGKALITWLLDVRGSREMPKTSILRVSNIFWFSQRFRTFIQYILSNTLNISIKFWRLYPISNCMTCSCLHKQIPMQTFPPPTPTWTPHLFKTKRKRKWTESKSQRGIFLRKTLTRVGGERF